MKTGRVSNVGLPFLAEFSSRDRGLAEKALDRLEAKQIKFAATRARKAEQIVETFKERLSGLLGAKKSAELRAAIARERRALHDLGQPPEGLRRDHGKDRQASRRRIATLARKLGANLNKVRRLQHECNAQLLPVLSAADGRATSGFNLATHYKKWAALTPFHRFPLPWGFDWPLDPNDPNDPHRWFLFQPPWFGFLFNSDVVTSSNFVADYEHVLMPPAGLVGNKATMKCTDASDFDLAHVISESQIAFRFDAPTTGVLEVVIDAQCTVDDHELTIEDEFWFSEAWCSHNTQLMMNVLHPTVAQPSVALMANMFEESDGDDLSAHRSILTQGSHYYAHLFSAGSVPGGQSVIITAGARTLDIARADDMELDSRSDCQWFINSVEVRISP